MNQLLKKVNNDPALLRRGRFYSAQIKLEFDDDSILFEVEDGKLIRLAENSDEPPANGFTLSASKKTWEKFQAVNPPPGFHDISAMLDAKHVSLSGNALLMLSNLFYVKGLIDHWKQEVVL